MAAVVHIMRRPAGPRWSKYDFIATYAWFGRRQHLGPVGIDTSGDEADSVLAQGRLDDVAIRREGRAGLVATVEGDRAQLDLSTRLERNGGATLQGQSWREQTTERRDVGGEGDGVVNHSISMPTRRALDSGNETPSMRLRASPGVRVRVGDGMG